MLEYLDETQKTENMYEHTLDVIFKLKNGTTIEKTFKDADAEEKYTNQLQIQKDKKEIILYRYDYDYVYRRAPLITWNGSFIVFKDKNTLFSIDSNEVLSYEVKTTDTFIKTVTTKTYKVKKEFQRS